MQRQAAYWKREGVRVGLVPTMGALHEGHMSLIRKARTRAGQSGVVVVSVYVNPLQFDGAKDLNRYPRDLAADKRACRVEGVDLVFAPENLHADDASVVVEENELANHFEGKFRPGHFAGVMTVVAKLFNLVQPEFAVFGEKDFQQSAVVRRMVRDLNLPVKIVMAPTVREADGLALSSRNVQLRDAARERARVLWEAIGVARAAGVTETAGLKRKLKRLIESRTGEVDYVAVVDAESLRPLKRTEKGARLLLAATVGGVRLIDNAEL